MESLSTGNDSDAPASKLYFDVFGEESLQRRLGKAGDF
jgi:hypothetical protein